MKSSLKLVVSFELLEHVVGFENIHSSFPMRAKTFLRVPNLLWNEVFSEIKSTLKWNLFETRGRLRTLWRRSWLWIYSLFISRPKMFSRVPNLLWNKVFSKTRGSLWTFRSTGIRLSGSTWIFSSSKAWSSSTPLKGGKRDLYSSW